jgi:hypothetical protein
MESGQLEIRSVSDRRTIRALKTAASAITGLTFDRDGATVIAISRSNTNAPPYRAQLFDARKDTGPFTSADAWSRYSPFDPSTNSFIRRLPIRPMPVSSLS